MGSIRPPSAPPTIPPIIAPFQPPPLIAAISSGDSLINRYFSSNLVTGNYEIIILAIYYFLLNYFCLRLEFVLPYSVTINCYLAIL